MESCRAERVLWTNPPALTGVKTYSPQWLTPETRGTEAGLFDVRTEAGKKAVEATINNAANWAATPHTIWISAPKDQPNAVEIWYGSGDGRNAFLPFKLPNPSPTRRLAQAAIQALLIADRHIDPGEPVRILLPCSRTGDAFTRIEQPVDGLICRVRNLIELLWKRKGTAMQFVVTDKRYDGRGYLLQAFLDGTYAGGAHGPAGPDQDQRVEGVNVSRRAKRTRLRHFPRPSSAK